MLKSSLIAGLVAAGVAFAIPSPGQADNDRRYNQWENNGNNRWQQPDRRDDRPRANDRQERRSDDNDARWQHHTDRRNDWWDDRRDDRRDDRNNNWRHNRRDDDRDRRWGPWWQHREYAHVRADRHRYYRQVLVVRPFGHWYSGYGHYRHDNDAYKWLALTAITIKILDNLNEVQERAHEQAQIEATRARVGETIAWNQGGASGRVTTLRDGTSSDGRYCREFRQIVTIGGRSEEAYGTACQQPDGAWEVVATR